MTSRDPRPRATPPPLPPRDKWAAITRSVVADARNNDALRPEPARAPLARPHQRGRTAITYVGELQWSELWTRVASQGQALSRTWPSARLNLGLTELAPSVLESVRSFIATLRPEPMPAPNAGWQDEPMSYRLERSLARELRRGGRTLAITAAVVFGWAGLVPLSGAVVVAGSLVVQSSVKKVQHPLGGIVTAIGIHNGSKVKAGEELARLDQTAARANLQVIARQLDEVRVRIARLKAERDGLQSPGWPTDSAAQLDTDERERLLASEREFFAARANARRGQQDLAESRISQLEKQVAGLEAQLRSNSKQMGITSGELKGVEYLLQQKLVTLPRATALQREAAHLDGVDGQLASQVAETRAKISETRLAALQAEQTFRSEVMRDLREAEAKEGELTERRLAAEDMMNRTVIRAPTAGVIHDLSIHTVGGVVAPAEVLMVVVPEDDTLEIDARLSPDKVDQVHVGQTAHVRLSAFNQRTTPELAGVVELLSADLVHDPQSTAAYYNVRIALPPAEVRRLGKLQLLPGMPAEVFLETDSRTMLGYLFKPVTDQLSRMFRER